MAINHLKGIKKIKIPELEKISFKQVKLTIFKFINFINSMAFNNFYDLIL